MQRFVSFLKDVLSVSQCVAKRARHPLFGVIAALIAVEQQCAERAKRFAERLPAHVCSFEVEPYQQQRQTGQFGSAIASK